MIMFKARFTSPQGVTHAAAVFVIVNAVLNENKSTSSDYDFNTETYKDNVTNNAQLNYKVVYWATEKAMLDGFEPYVLTNTDSANDLWFYTNADMTKYAGKLPVEIAELELQAKLGLTPIV